MPTPRRNSRLSKCSICGQPALAGGRLCAPCRSALKRARDTTVSEGILPVRRGRKRPAPPAAPPPVVEAAVEPALRAVPRGPRLSWAIAAALVVVVAIGWFVHSHGDAGAAASRYAGSPDDAGAGSTSAASETSVTQAPVQAAFTEADRPSAPAAREPMDLRRMPSSIAVPRAAPKEPPAPLPQAATPPVIAPPEPPPAPAPIVVAQAPVPKAVPDRWQRLSDQLAACPADAFKRAVCQESLRIEYCEGFWGRVAPCPAKVERDYGN